MSDVDHTSPVDAAVSEVFSRGAVVEEEEEE